MRKKKSHLVNSLTPLMMQWRPEWYEKKPEPPVEDGKVIQFDAFARALEKQQVDLPPEVAKAIDEHFWELL